MNLQYVGRQQLNIVIYRQAKTFCGGKRRTQLAKVIFGKHLNHAFPTTSHLLDLLTLLQLQPLCVIESQPLAGNFVALIAVFKSKALYLVSSINEMPMSDGAQQRAPLRDIQKSPDKLKYASIGDPQHPQLAGRPKPLLHCCCEMSGQDFQRSIGFHPSGHGQSGSSFL